MTETTIAPPAPKPSFASATEILKASLPHYEQRPQQTTMAEAIEALLAARPDGDMPAALAVQAGTGTGKSFALAIPAAYCGRRTVISTATLALQNQLVGLGGDFPFLAEHLPDFPAFAILKGRGNYACLAKLEDSPAEFEGLAELRAELALPDAVGDRDSLKVQISSEDWQNVSATSAECPGPGSCPLSDRCFAQKAIATAAEAEIVVTNHAMLGTAMALEEQTEGAVQLLGEYSFLLVDEADGLDDALRNTLTKKLTLRGLAQLAAQAQSFVHANASAEDKAKNRDKDLPESVALLQAAAALTAILPATPDPARPGEAPAGDKLALAWFGENGDIVEALTAALRNVSARLRRVETGGPKETIRKRLLRAQAVNAADALTSAFLAEDDEMVRYVEWFKHPKSPDLFWTMQFCPVDISGLCRDQLWSRQTTVLASATLTTAPGDFAYFTRTLGLEHAKTLDVGTPFAYGTQAMLFVPGPNIPDPNQGAAWTSYVATATQALVSSSGGGALLLYTSRKAMNEVHALLAPQLRRQGLTVLIQDGKTSNAELARIFKQDKDSVLFGLKSFFVGLDVPGDALRLVVIDKLPFPVPSDFVFAARSLAEEKAGRWPFFSLSVPKMTLDLTQAFGRLIRRRSDRGVVAILDSRLSSKRYGPQIVAGLPDCPAVVNLGDVEKFFQAA